MENRNEEPMSISPANLIPTMQLVNELLNRFDHAIFVGAKSINRDDKITIRRWRGNHHTCAGMAMDVAQTTINTLHDIEADVNAEDI